MQTIKNNKFIIAFIIFFIILIVFFWQNNKTTEQSNPEQVVRQFIQADMAGERLGAQFTKETPDIFSYTSWESAPGYDEWMVIDDYIIEGSNVKDDSAEVKVGFDCLAGNLKYNSEGEITGIEKCGSENETAVFYLEKRGNQWKITSPHIIPHISEDTMLKFFEMNKIDLSIQNNH